MIEQPFPIYVIEDDDAVRTSLSRALRLRGFEVVSFANAEAFLDRVPQLDQGCIVSDFNLPGGTGEMLQSEISLQPREFPLIFMTGAGDKVLEAHAVSRGAIGVLRKPFRPERLIELIETAFAKLTPR